MLKEGDYELIQKDYERIQKEKMQYFEEIQKLKEVKWKLENMLKESYNPV